MPRAYAVIQEENGAFGISFPDFPGCIAGGATEEEVILRATDALNFHVAGMIEDGDQLPFLRSLSELKHDPDFAESISDGVLTIIPFDLPGTAVRINISIDENLLESVDRAAQAVGQSRSAYLADAARKKLRA